MTHASIKALRDQEIGQAIRSAAAHGIKLTPGDFEIIDGDVFLDGMDPVEWIDAMVMD